MHLYHDLIEKIPEFKKYDIFDEEHYIDIGVSPLGTIGSWLNDLVNDKYQNDEMIQKICHYLNNTYLNANRFTRDIRNDFQVYMFWALKYPTIHYIKQYLDSSILEDGRKYLRAIDGENYQEF